MELDLNGKTWQTKQGRATAHRENTQAIL